MLAEAGSGSGAAATPASDGAAAENADGTVEAAGGSSSAAGSAAAAGSSASSGTGGANALELGTEAEESGDGQK